MKVDEKLLRNDRMECGVELGKLLTKHAAFAGWRHRAFSFVEQEGIQPMPKDLRCRTGRCSWSSGAQLGRGSGNVGNSATRWRWEPFPGGTRRSSWEHRSRMHSLQKLPAWWLRKAHQENVGVADIWYFDGGDILCHPVLVPCPSASLRHSKR